MLGIVEIVILGLATLRKLPALNLKDSSWQRLVTNVRFYVVENPRLLCIQICNLFLEHMH